MMESRIEKLRLITGRRWRVALALTAVMTTIYFGFILLVAKAKSWLGEQPVAGLSWGIALGAGVIVSAWLLTFIYVRWANTRYDPAIRRIREHQDSQ